MIARRWRGSGISRWPALTGRTAEDMVAAGQAQAVLRHLEALEHGGFA